MIANLSEEHKTSTSDITATLAFVEQQLQRHTAADVAQENRVCQGWVMYMNTCLSKEGGGLVRP